MIKLKRKEECCGCSACQQICPQSCISMKKDIEGFLYPFIDKERCINCNLCNTICPIINHTEWDDAIIKSYVGYSTNEEIRLKSSSGGIFSVLAEYILKSGKAVIYGATLDKNQKVYHMRIDSISNLDLLRRSKYLQSKINETFKNAKMDLEAGLDVLYSGTACQIAGLKAFLRKEYKNLYTIDVLCHGVPSPKVWNAYTKWQKNKNNVNIREVYFRDKESGWKNYSMKLVFDNEKNYIKPHGSDMYSQVFLSEICLRPSCHECKFKGLNRLSDLTLGDAWGIDKCMPEMDDDKGTSVIIVHSIKGQELLSKIKNAVNIMEIDIDKILPSSSDSRKSVQAHKRRTQFFKLLNIFDYKIFSIWKQYVRCQRIKTKIRKQ